MERRTDKQTLGQNELLRKIQELAFMKVGTLSYPAKEYLGKIYLNDLGLPRNEILSCFEFNSYLTDASLVKTILGKRGENTNKGSFGKALVITGKGIVIFLHRFGISVMEKIFKPEDEA